MKLCLEASGWHENRKIRIKEHYPQFYNDYLTATRFSKMASQFKGIEKFLMKICDLKIVMPIDESLPRICFNLDVLNYGDAEWEFIISEFKRFVGFYVIPIGTAYISYIFIDMKGNLYFLARFDKCFYKLGKYFEGVESILFADNAGNREKIDLTECKIDLLSV